MPLSDLKLDTTARFVEIQNLYRYIKSRDAEIPVCVENQIIKGLFIVGLYGFVEFSITKMISASLAYINNASVKHNHLIPDLYPVLLHDGFKSIADLRGEKQWVKRHELITSQYRPDLYKIDDSSINSSIQNIRASTIVLILKLFGVSGKLFAEDVSAAYLNEICERRNAVAHGRESPTEVGRRYTADLLEKRAISINSQVTFMIIQFEYLLKDKKFIRTRYRKQYNI